MGHENEHKEEAGKDDKSPFFHENKMKEIAREKKGVLLDSVTITMGSAAKGTAVALKCYLDLLDVSGKDEPDNDTDRKIENLFKLREKIKIKGFIVDG